jgi:hypothetical protein
MKALAKSWAAMDGGPLARRPGPSMSSSDSKSDSPSRNRGFGGVGHRKIENESGRVSGRVWERSAS